MRTGLMAASALLLFTVAANAQKGGARPPSPCKHWKAWQDLQPGTADLTLHVTGKCEFPTAGYTVELVPVQTKQGSNPQISVLKRVVHKPEGMAAQVITEVPVDYSAETKIDYTEVKIHPDRVRVRVKKMHHP